MADLEGKDMKNLARGAPADLVLQLKKYNEPNSRRTWVLRSSPGELQTRDQGDQKGLEGTTS
jgi:hypothetical protein